MWIKERHNLTPVYRGEVAVGVVGVVGVGVVVQSLVLSFPCSDMFKLC